MADPVFDPEAMYAIKLARPVKVGRTMLLPSHVNKVRGDIAEQIKADILEFVRVDD